MKSLKTDPFMNRYIITFIIINNSNNNANKYQYHKDGKTLGYLNFIVGKAHPGWLLGWTL